MAFNQKVSIETHTFSPRRGMLASGALPIAPLPLTGLLSTWKRKASKTERVLLMVRDPIQPMVSQRGPVCEQGTRATLSADILSFSLSLLFFSTSLTLPSCLCKAVCESECVCVCLQHALAVIHPPSLLGSLQPPQYSLVRRDIRVSQSLSQCVCETGEIAVKSLAGHLCSLKSLCNQYKCLKYQTADSDIEKCQ